MSALRLVTLSGDPEREAALAARLTHDADAELVLRCVDRVEMLAALRSGGVDAVVSIGLPPWLDKQCLEEVSRAGARLVGVLDDPLEADRLSSWGAVLLTSDASPDEILVAAAAGPPPLVPPAVPEALERRGRLLAVWGPKGSPGRTSVAIELAAELASSEPDTLLIDGDPYGGDVLQVLGIVEELPTVVWAAQMAAKEELVEDLLERQLRRAGKDGPVILPGLPRGELWAEVSQYGWSELLAFARAAFTFTICDVGFCLESSDSPYPGSGEGRNRMARTAISTADRVVAVCRADAIGIKQFLWAFEQLDEMIDPDDVVIVVNRARASEQRDIANVIRRHLGRRVLAFVPDRPAEFLDAARNGTTIRQARPGSEVTGGIRSLAAAVGGRVSPQGLMAKLAGRR
ncbi:MAG: AAA family ATPase [Actinomycetota bacterium]